MALRRPLKLTTVGDDLADKTCLLVTYTQHEFPQEYVPTVFDNHACSITVDEKDYNLTLWDTAGQEDYERLRPLSYPNTNCFLLCYSISCRESFDNIYKKWYPEIKHFAPKVPIVLIGTKMEQRTQGCEDCVTTKEGKKLKRKIKAVAFIECSVNKNENLNDIFEAAVREAIKANNRKQNIFTRLCNII